MNRMKKYSSRLSFILPRAVLAVFFLVYVTFAFLSYFDYFEPYLYPLAFIRGKAYPVSDSIIIGPYPHHAELKKLKEGFGVTVVISLLNLNLPQEKALFEREKEYARELGLGLTPFPMEYLPLRSDNNRRTVGKLIGFVRERPGARVYIHCYLGRHRTGLVAEGLRDAGFALTGEGDGTFFRGPK